MNRIKIFIPLLLLLFGGVLTAQNEKKALRNAERHLGFDEYSQAIPYLEEAKGYNPENALTVYLLGKCYFIAYKKSKALENFQKAMELNAGIHPDLPLYYARSLHYFLKFDKAITAYKQARANYPGSSPRLTSIDRAIQHCEYGKGAVKLDNGAKIVNVGAPINTQWGEHSPVISADEGVLIYTTVRPDNEGCSGDPMCPYEDIYITERLEDGSWSTPKPISKRINSKDYDASIALSPDGQELFIYKNPPGNGDIFKCVLKGDEWSAPKSMGWPVNSKYYETTVSVSPDGNRLYFTSDREGGLGDTDIYYSDLGEDGDWSDPVNIGDKINTAGADDSPFIHPDGKTLYFSSKGRKECLGGFDIYKTVMQSDGSWSDPVNIGYPINTPDDDIYFVLSASGKHGYYASAKEGGIGEKDIYKIIMPEPKKVVVKADTEVVAPVIVEVQLTILKGKVTDKETGEPLEASIRVLDNEKGKVISTFTSNSKTGKYLVSLPSGKNYGIEVENKKYLFHSENVNLPDTSGYHEIEKNIALERVDIGSTIILRNIFFDYDKATLRPESKTELDRVFQLLNDNPRMVVEIGGHTDSDGSDTYNQKLSENRAISVVEYLVDKGIPSARLQAKGYGEKVAIDTNETPEGKQNNRRTELKILSN